MLHIHPSSQFFLTLALAYSAWESHNHIGDPVTFQHKSTLDQHNKFNQTARLLKSPFFSPTQWIHNTRIIFSFTIGIELIIEERICIIFLYRNAQVKRPTVRSEEDLTNNWLNVVGREIHIGKHALLLQEHKTPFALINSPPHTFPDNRASESGKLKLFLFWGSQVQQWKRDGYISLLWVREEFYGSPCYLSNPDTFL